MQQACTFDHLSEANSTIPGMILIKTGANSRTISAGMHIHLSGTHSTIPGIISINPAYEASTCAHSFPEANSTVISVHPIHAKAYFTPDLLKVDCLHYAANVHILLP